MASDKENAPHDMKQAQLELDLMLGKTREFAERMVERLRALHEKFPSEELANAIRSLEAWRDELPSQAD